MAFRDLAEEILEEFAGAAGRGAQRFIPRPEMRGSPEDMSSANPRLLLGKSSMAEWNRELRANRRARGQCAHCGTPSPARYRCLVCSLRQRAWNGDVERLTKEEADLRRVKRNIVRQSLDLQRGVESVVAWLRGQQEIALLNVQGVGVTALCKSKQLLSKSKTWADQVMVPKPRARPEYMLRVNLGKDLKLPKKRGRPRKGDIVHRPIGKGLLPSTVWHVQAP